MRMFNIPNLFTAANLMCGVLAIFLSFSGHLAIAPYFIFLGAVLDFFDGFLARLLNQQGELGKQLDSLADMVTFGLAPGVIMMQVLIAMTICTGIGPCMDEGFQVYTIADKDYTVVVTFNIWIEQFFTGEQYNFIPLFALLIPFFSMFRLAKFNIDTRQSESFIGLPTPANTIFFCAFPLLLSQFSQTTGWQHDLIMWLVQPVVLVPIIIVMSLLLVAEIPLFALKFKTFKWKGNEIRYLFLISCAILIPSLLVWSIPIIILLYLLLSIINNVRKSGQQNKKHEIQS